MSRMSIVAVTASLLMASSAFASSLYPSHALGFQNSPPPGHHKVKSKGGVVGADGSIILGTWFSVSHDATGEYTLDIPGSVFGTSICPVILITPAGVNGHAPIADDFNYITCKAGDGEVKMQIRIYSRTDGALQDNAFHFLMIEP